MEPTEHQVTLEIICLHPPTQQGVFGLQDKNHRLHPPAQLAGGSAISRCKVQAKQGAANDPPNFLGTFTHGIPQDRFLYLSLRPADGPANGWIRRIKVPLKSITWEQVAAAAGRADTRLACTLDGGGAGRVKLIRGGWRVVRD